MDNVLVRFGLIGCGAWGRCHGEAIRQCPDAQLVVIAERNADARAAAGAAFPQAEVVEDYHQLLGRNDIDVVDIVLPSYLHHEVASAALASGKHMLLEKPMCLTLPHCDDLIGVARRRKLHVAVNHEFRLSSLWGQVKRMVEDGFVGTPQYVLVELSRNPYRLGSDGWRFDIDRVGSWILEEPIHFFDLARWYLESTGQPESVYATANSRQPGHPELHDNFSAIVRFDGGGYAVVTQTLSAFEHHQTVKITGTKGALWASWSGAMDRVRHAQWSLRAFDGTEVQDIPILAATGELYELEAHIRVLVGAIRAESKLSCTGEDGRWSVAMCLAAAESAARNEAVAIDRLA